METLHVLIFIVSVCIIDLNIYPHIVNGPMVFNFYLLIRHKTCDTVDREMVLCSVAIIESFAGRMSYDFPPLIGQADELQSGRFHKTVL